MLLLVVYSTTYIIFIATKTGTLIFMTFLSLASQLLQPPPLFIILYTKITRKSYIVNGYLDIHTKFVTLVNKFLVLILLDTMAIKVYSHSVIRAGILIVPPFEADCGTTFWHGPKHVMARIRGTCCA